MSGTSGKTTRKTVQAPTNEYEKLRLERIEANKAKLENLGVTRIVASMTSLVDSTKEKKEVNRIKSKVMLDQDNDYTPEDDPSDDGNDEEAVAANKKRKAHSKDCAKKGTKRNFIPPNSIGSLLAYKNNMQGKGNKGGNMQLTAALKVLQKAIDSQQEEEVEEKMDFDEEMQESDEFEESDEGNNEFHEQEGGGNNTGASTFANDQEGKRKTKKSYKTKSPRGPTRNLQMAKMRPGEKIKVDFDVSGQPIGVNRASLSSYYGSLVRDPLNAPLNQIEEFSQVPGENKEKMWKLILDKFDIGLDDDQDEEEHEKKRRKRRKYIMTSLNKKYRNFRSRLKREYYDTEETDEDRLKEENRPPNVDEKDWEWLVVYFGSPKFQKKSRRDIENRSYLDAGHTAGTKSFAQKVQDMFEHDKVMPGLLELYEETHTRSDKTPVTKTAQDIMNEIKQLVEQRKTSETKMTDEEIYATVKPKRKPSARDRRKGMSPSVTSLFCSFNEGEKFRREAETAKNEATEAKKEAIEANKENETLKTKVKGIEKECRATRRALECFMNAFGYNLTDLKMDELIAEEPDDEPNEESDKIQKEVEDFGEE